MYSLKYYILAIYIFTGKRLDHVCDQLCNKGSYIFKNCLLGFTAQRLKVCRTLGPTTCLKMLTERCACLKKMQQGEKIHECT